jgi:hypothetical protein
VRLTHRASDDLTLSAVGQARRFDQTLRLNFYDPFGLDLSRNVVAFNGFVSDQSQTVYFAEATLAYERGGHSIVAGVSGERAASIPGRDRTDSRPSAASPSISSKSTIRQARYSMASIPASSSTIH